jgi:hypothetical protein
MHWRFGPYGLLPLWFLAHALTSSPRDASGRAARNTAWFFVFCFALLWGYCVLDDRFRFYF